jgi:hypothetical protein
LAAIDVVGAELNIDEDRDQIVLEDGIERGGESGGDGDDLIAGTKGTLAESGGGQRGERYEIGGRAGVNQARVADSDDLGEFALELFGEASGG